MKRVIMSVALVAAIAAGYMMTGSNESKVNMSELAQANVEALGQALPPSCTCEKGGVYCDCPGEFTWGKTAKLIEPDD
ncbi:MAG: hypothetical protein J6U14_08275 [Bacteroidaceae bacterium]|nr:hypothetical protein [Bacteroidaceae bacterium]